MHLLFDHFQFALIHGPNIPGSYAILFFTTLDFTSITSHIHNWVLFLLWFHLFILSGVISPLISSSILGAYRPGEFLFWYPIILPFHTVHGVFTAIMVSVYLPSDALLQHLPSYLGFSYLGRGVSLHSCCMPYGPTNPVIFHKKI